MRELAKDWLRQAEKDLRHARRCVQYEDFEWVCFSAQQAAEKAAKALFYSINIEVWGRSVSKLLSNLPDNVKPSQALIDFAKELDKHHITSRYPNAYPSGTPMDYYTKIEAERAVNYATKIIEFCKNQIV
ncbi:MAG: HEPN domain-containing protein [Promethearchaeota archaeon]